MHVQLSDDVTQGADIQLVTRLCVTQHLSHKCHFLPQLLLIIRCQVEDLGNTLSVRHQYQPVITAIVQ
ncbi:hypothetical protein RSA46_06325 [Pseudomonas oryzihabitans]|nr:hypothetical protein SB14R_04805 [Pseudomonas psychrotolerans]KTT28299.1 hypothetical protein NS201_20860 [Pseudomonas psychrotolerans]KTT32990.1 hypothetical protein SB9_14365 [Pseudomonas psychrotolerans]KTT36132.1 hypothetical protein SB5_21435 [Pseudomonas psychrotolerans]KTT45689.1 hypothetical protein RSA46_06325 [Pseudomonas psychrotolerans]